MSIRYLPLLAALALLVTGCEEPPPREDEPVAVDGAALVVEVMAPSRMDRGAEEEIAIEVRNEGDGAAGPITLHLVVPGWLRVARGDEVAEVRESEWGVRMTFPGPPGGLDPGDSWSVTQAVQRPEDELTETERLGSVIRTWITGEDGEVLAIGGDVRVPVTAARERRAPFVTAEGVGPARLGAEAGVLREQVPAARDTVTDGQSAIVVPVAEGREALAWITEGIVVRVIVSDPGLRLDTGIGVGSPLERLRKVYGYGCVRGSDGAALAFFPTAPGLEFRLDAAAQAEAPVPLERADIPEGTEVSEIWVRRSPEPCPAPAR